MTYYMLYLTLTIVLLITKVNAMAQLTRPLPINITRQYRPRPRTGRTLRPRFGQDVPHHALWTDRHE